MTGVDVSDNTNLWGAPPAARRVLAEAVADARGEALCRYPSLDPAPLHAAILRYLQLDDAQAVTGCGSDDVIDATMRAFGAAGERVAYSAPTFSMVPVFARLNGLEPVAIPLTADYDVDAERLVECGATITYLCAPNNPTGTGISRAAAEYVAAHARGIVLLDEAYAEFAPASFTDLAARHERVLVVRTFSKAFGLAGLRVGYGAGSAELVARVARALGPYRVNALAERAALAALEESAEGLGWVRTHARLAVELRDRVAAALARLGVAPLPSAANFLCVPLADAGRVARRMREAGVLVRAFSGLPRELPAFARAEGEALRIGVGPWDTMQRVLGALEEALR